MHRVKASTLVMDRSRISRHVKPLIGALTVVSLSAQDVAKMQADIIAGRTAAPRAGRGGATTGGKGAASRTVGMLSTILEFAVGRGVIEKNPARSVDRPSDGRQRRFLSLAEVTRLGAALKAGVAEGEAEVGAAAVRFLLLSGCRRMEALSLQMDWVDRPARCGRFPDTKSGTQIRAMGPPALDALAQAGEPHAWAFKLPSRTAARGTGLQP